MLAIPGRDFAPPGFVAPHELGTYWNPTPGLGTALGTIDGVNPGTREVVVCGYNLLVPFPIPVYGHGCILAGMTDGTSVKARFAIARANANRWQGSAGVDSCLPTTLVIGDSAGVTLSSLRTNAGGASMRFMEFSYGSSVILEPGRYWIMKAIECVYAADVAWSSHFGGYSDNVCMLPHEIGSTGNSRGIMAKALHTGGIDTLAWSSYMGLAAASWASAAASSATLTGRTWTGGIAAIGWGLITEPI